MDLLVDIIGKVINDAGSEFLRNWRNDETVVISSSASLVCLSADGLDLDTILLN
jgi:hypothetical protein